MIVYKEALVVQPIWCLLPLMAYVISFYVFCKTLNIHLATIVFFAWVCISMCIIYWYHGFPL